MGKVIRIEKEIPFLQPKKRVAAYARVSSGKDAMLHSLSAQVAFYSNLIHGNSDWEYAGVYADEAFTGTKERRPEFQRLLSDCRDGKIDIILTKSLSRFARNTVTTLTTIRELRLLEVDVWFERENIHSLSAEGEFLLTILASVAQEESRSASENQKWKIRKNFSEGIPTVNPMLGYRYENGAFVIVPEEAEIVRMIFDDYLSGMGRDAIVKKLMTLGVPTKLGKAWHGGTIEKMLQNEKYTGDMLLQKTYSMNHITKKTAKNTGQLPQYYVENSHTPIIPKEVFLAVQEEIKKRSHGQRIKPSCTYPYTGKIICEKCGKHYRRKQTKAGYRWVCSTNNALGKAFCDAQSIPEYVLDGIIQGKAFQEIRVPAHGLFHVRWSDGTETSHTWENRSRAESWTPEMRERARERSLLCHRKQ